MVRKSLLVVSAIMALSIAVLWPVSYWWHSTWYDTIQNGTLRGYWCGYALVNGDFVMQWDSQMPPNLALPAFSMASPRGPVTYFDGLGEEPSSRYVGVRIPPSSGTWNPPSPSVIYNPDNLVAFAFWGFKLDYDPNMRVAYIDTPLPMLAFPFALLALLFLFRKLRPLGLGAFLRQFLLLLVLPGMADLELVTAPEDIATLRGMIQDHLSYTNSVPARRILENWEETLPKFKKIMPRDYRRVLEERKDRQEQELEVTSNG